MQTEFKQERGVLTQRIKDLSLKLLGYEINESELRLMPYLQYVMVNEQKINPVKVNTEDRQILAKWKQKGYTEGGINGIRITKEFWNIICEIICAGYVDITE